MYSRHRDGDDYDDDDAEENVLIFVLPPAILPTNIYGYKNRWESAMSTTFYRILLQMTSLFTHES